MVPPSPSGSHSIEFGTKEERDMVLALLSGGDAINRVLEAEIDTVANRCWIQTRCGEAFYPANPDHSKIRLSDIAHSLSNLSRYCGHCEHFYSVAEHSVHVVQDAIRRKLGDDASIWNLPDISTDDLQLFRSSFLHDAPEGYICDLTAPLKKMCRGYKIIEKRVANAVERAFDLKYPLDHPEIVKSDISVFLAEKEQIIGDETEPWGVRGEPARNCVIHCWSPERAQDMFLQAAERLGL